jgi:hypothetical protein
MLWVIMRKHPLATVAIVVRIRLLALLIPLALVACANDDADLYKPPQGLTPSNSAALRVGQVDTGFLFFGNTLIRVDSIDGRRRVGYPDQPTLLVPGVHDIKITARRDPVSAFACVHADFEAGKTYILQATKPEMDKTTIWLEDAANGEAVSKKISAQMIRDPGMLGPGLRKLLVHPVSITC